jgi:hypothetical protein
MRRPRFVKTKPHQNWREDFAPVFLFSASDAKRIVSIHASHGERLVK